MDVLRTPDERFDDLDGWPFRPHYADVEADGSGPLRMAYVDEGPADGPVVVLLHGERLLFETLDLRRVLLFGQDWGGLVGLRLGSRRSSPTVPTIRAASTTASRGTASARSAARSSARSAIRTRSPGAPTAS